MKNVIAAAALSLVLSDFAYANEKRDEAMMKITPSTLVDADIHAVSPALARFGREAITEDLWTREALSPRDRSIVTVAMLIARNQPGELKHYIEVALDSGVTPAEVSEIITHLAFYSGWPNAMSAVSVTKRNSVQRPWKKMSAPFRLAWLNLPPTRCFSTSGNGPRLRPATEVW